MSDVDYILDGAYALAPSRSMFRFHQSSERPYGRVTCLGCGWKAEGDDVRGTFRRADTHVCHPERKAATQEGDDA